MVQRGRQPGGGPRRRGQREPGDGRGDVVDVRRGRRHRVPLHAGRGLEGDDRAPGPAGEQRRPDAGAGAHVEDRSGRCAGDGVAHERLVGGGVGDVVAGLGVPLALGVPVDLVVGPVVVAVAVVVEPVVVVVGVGSCPATGPQRSRPTSRWRAAAARASAAGVAGSSGQRRLGPVDVGRRLGDRVGHAVAVADEGERPGLRLGRRAGRRAGARSSSPAGPGQRAQHRQVVDALGHVVAGRLAQLLVGGDHVEHVVDDLERHAVVQAEVGERVDLVAGQVGDDAADAAGGRVERRRLALDGGLVGVERAVDLVGELQLADLAGAQPADRGRQQPRHLGAERRGQLGGPGQQEVARQDRPQVAPAGVDAVDAVAGLGLVDDVVVVQRPDVHQLAGHAAGHGLVADHGVGVAGRWTTAPPAAAAGACPRPGPGATPSRSWPRRRSRPPPAAASRPARAGPACRAGRAAGWGRPRVPTLRDQRRGPKPADPVAVTVRVLPRAIRLRSPLFTQAAVSSSYGGCRVSPRIPRLAGGKSLVRTVHRPGSTGRGAGPRGSPAPQPQLHRHRAHPARPHPRG